MISSNLERLIYRIAGNDAEKNAALMKELNETGKYTITDEMKKNLDCFYGNFASTDEVAAEIKAVYDEDGYVMDTHTAVANTLYMMLTRRILEMMKLQHSLLQQLLHTSSLVP